MTVVEIMDGIAEAIATMEGFHQAGSLAHRNNNPGNLRAWGNLPVVDGYVKFYTPHDGRIALLSQIWRNVYARKLTLLEFFGGKPGVYPGYAPASDKNDPVAYAHFVAKRTGLNVDTPIWDQAEAAGEGGDED